MKKQNNLVSLWNTSRLYKIKVLNSRMERKFYKRFSELNYLYQYSQLDIYIYFIEDIPLC